MINEQDIKDLYLVSGFMLGLASFIDDWVKEESETSRQIDYLRVKLWNIIDRLEKEYESERY